MFFDKEEEEHDFLSPGGSKLGALFGMDKAENTGGNSSLTYTAPKQPKKKETTPPGKGAAPAVTFAVAVHAYKYVDNQYASQGKLGAAILANHSTNEYSILMYVSQQQKVTTAKITSAFSYTSQANNYANFYDDARQSWSILFDNEQNSIDFAKNVCLAKALSTGATPSALVSQDLVGGDGGALETGDSVEVKYTGWLLANNTFGQVFDSNVKAEKLFRFKLGAGKVIKGWDSGVVGMKKSGKRFLVVPPPMAYGSQGMGSRVPANSTLLFEVEVVRVKLVGRESSPSPAPPAVQPAPVQAPVVVEDKDEFEEDDQTVKGRTRSISDQLSHSPTQDTSKAKLISRMAKMGKPMLPFSGAVAASPESDEESVPESPQPVTSKPAHHEAVHKPVPKSLPQQSVTPPSEQQHAFTVIQNQGQPQPAFLQNIPAAQQMALYQPQQNFQQQQQPMMQPGFQQQMYGGGVPNQPPQAVPGTSFPPYVVPGMTSGGQEMMLLSETRQQNTEVRLSLSKVNDKVDQVIHKLDQAHSQNSGSSMLPNMETSVLLHNITRIVQENERLKKDVFEKSGKIESQNEKISELLQRNQSYVEKSQVLMEQRNEGLLSSASQSQSKLLSLEQDKVKLTKDLTDATSQISTLQLEVATLKKKEFEISQQMDSSVKDTRRQSEELDSLKSQHKNDESLITDLQKQLREEKQARKTAESSVSQVQEEMADLKAAKASVEKNLTERKRKAAEDRRQLEDELEDVKTNLEADIQSLKGKLRKQKSSATEANQEQISQMEEEINADWQRKSDKLLAVAAEKHSRALLVVKEEKDEVEEKVQELENKIQTMRSSSSGSDQRVSELEEQLEEMGAWKNKYDNIRTQVTTMKERYEEKIKELEEERDNLDEQKDELEKQVAKLTTELKTAQAQGASSGAVSAGGSMNLLEEVKRIMNTVYKEMREVFESEQKYTGTEILAVILNSIKSTTLELMKRQKEGETNVEDEEDSEDESEEEEEEDEEEDENQSDNEDEDEGEAAESVVKKEDNQTQRLAAPEEHIKTDIDHDETEQSKTDDMGDDDVDDDDDEEEEEEEEEEGSNENKDDDDDNDNKLEVNTEKKSEVVMEAEEKVDVISTVSPGNSDEVVKENIGNELDAGGDGVTLTDKQTTEQEPAVQTNKSSDTNLKKAGSLEDLLDSALDKSSKVEKKMESSTMPLVSTEPPPFFDDSSEEEEKEVEKDRTKSIFNDNDEDDDHVADTLGITTKPVVNGDTAKTTTDRQTSNDEDLKPKPPPPLFGDDDDDDDLDWLS